MQLTSYLAPFPKYGGLLVVFAVGRGCLIFNALFRDEHVNSGSQNLASRNYKYPSIVYETESISIFLTIYACPTSVRDTRTYGQTDRLSVSKCRALLRCAANKTLIHHRNKTAASEMMDVYTSLLCDCFSQISTNESSRCVLLASQFCYNPLELRVFQGSVQLTEFLCGEGRHSTYMIHQQCIFFTWPTFFIKNMSLN